MKIILAVAAALVMITPVFARGGSHSSSHSASYSLGGSHAIRGYTKSDGQYVAPAHATNPNATKTDNWTTRGNVNPYTGKAGTKPGY
jgi:hypothetical protein